MREIVDVIVVGAGQAGLAMSHVLRERCISHLVLERGRVGEHWRSQRWDSFRLLSPNWHTRLPGYHYRGRDPDGFMTGHEFADLLVGYARHAPVRTGVAVTAVRPHDGGWRVQTEDVELWSPAVVGATGDMHRPRIPWWAGDLDPGLPQLHSGRYRNADALPDGPVLVVGAGPSGQQIALDLALAGRPVHLSVGGHRMLPRHYRGRDAFWWLDRLGLSARTSYRSAGSAGLPPNPVLAAGRLDLHLPRLADAGVRLHGRMHGARLGLRPAMTFADDVAASYARALAGWRRFRSTADEYLRRHEVAAAPPDADHPVLRWKPDAGETELALGDLGAVVWATGYRPDHRWLPTAVVGDDGRVIHDRGVTGLPGLYLLGLRWQHRQSSASIDGVGRDAEYLADRIGGQLTQVTRRLAS